MKITEYETLDSDVENEENWEMFEEAVRDRFRNRKFPVCLMAAASNWQGSTGYSIAYSEESMLAKIMSFGGSWVELHSTRGGALEFRTASHDVPTGFTILVRGIKHCPKCVGNE